MGLSFAVGHFLCSCFDLPVYQARIDLQIKKHSAALSPQANYTD
jgi:hypothetical protein